MVLPLIIGAPHAKTTVSDDVKQRLKLTDYDIWRFGDPFTDETCQHPEAFAIHLGSANRLLCDPSHGPDPVKKFRTHDFYGNEIYKDGQEFSEKERTQILIDHAVSYRANIAQSVKELTEQGHKKILFIDHHNTAGEHPVGKTGEYMPLITFCNGGEQGTGTRLDDDEVYSCPAEYLITMKDEFQADTNHRAEINMVYRQSHTVRWLMNDIAPLYPDVTIDAIFIEYNLSFIHNPLTKNNDFQAVAAMKDAINRGITRILN